MAGALASVTAAPLLTLLVACDAGLKPEPASANCATGICGVVRFRGAVPDSTDYVRVVVYAFVPTSAAELTAFAGFSDPLPLGGDSAFYSCCVLPLPPGQYGWVLVVWKKQSDSALSVTTAPALLREAGIYYDPADSTKFGTVVVSAGGGVGGVDMVADFGKMRSISDFFPAARTTRR